MKIADGQFTVNCSRPIGPIGDRRDVDTSTLSINPRSRDPTTSTDSERSWKRDDSRRVMQFESFPRSFAITSRKRTSRAKDSPSIGFRTSDRFAVARDLNCNPLRKAVGSARRCRARLISINGRFRINGPASSIGVSQSRVSSPASLARCIERRAVRLSSGLRYQVRISSSREGRCGRLHFSRFSDAKRNSPFFFLGALHRGITGRAGSLFAAEFFVLFVSFPVFSPIFRSRVILNAENICARPA